MSNPKQLVACTFPGCTVKLRPGSLRTHMGKHRPVPCAVSTCKKTFAVKWVHKKHLLMDHGADTVGQEAESSFHCTMCETKADDLRRLVDHCVSAHFPNAPPKASKEEVKAALAAVAPAGADPSQFQYCNGCRRAQSIDDFPADKTHKNLHSAHCSTCKRASHKAAVGKVHEYIQEHKRTIKNCPECFMAIDDTDRLEFAHTNRADKYRTRTGNTRNLSNLDSFRAVKDELAKGRYICLK